MKIYNYVLIFCLIALNTTAHAHTTKTSVDWDGYYTGTIPCGSCPGIKVWLELTEAAGKTHYQLIEIYEGNKGDVFHSKGTGFWHKDGSTLDLKAKDENRSLWVSENFVVFLGEDDNPATGKLNKEYTLHKLKAYAGGGQQLLMDDTQVKIEKSGSSHKISFPALLNFQQTTQGGHQSLTADWVIDCKSESYVMPSIAYYEKRFATGKLIHSAKNNADDSQPLEGNNKDVIQQVADEYCHIND